MSTHLYCPPCGKPPHGSAACQAAPGWPTQEACDVVTTARIIDDLRKRIAELERVLSQTYSQRLGDLERDNRNLHGVANDLRAANAEMEDELTCAKHLNAKWCDEKTQALIERDKARLGWQREARNASRADAALELVEAELAAAINIAVMARQNYDENGDGFRPLADLEAEVRRDVARLAAKERRETP
jgi:hypothetical protein